MGRSADARHTSVRGLVLRSQMLSWLILLLVAAAVLWSVDRNTRAARLASQSQTELMLVEAVLADVVDMETGLRGYVITGDGTFLDPYLIGRRELPGHLAALRAEATRQGEVLDHAHLAAIERVTDLAAQWESTYAVPLLSLRDIDPSGAARMVGEGRGKAFTDDIRAELGTYRELARATQARLELERSETRGQLQLITLVGLIASLLVSIITSRSVAVRLQETFRDLGRASRRIAAGNLGDRVPISHITEAAALGADFNAMASQLERRTADLAETVDELQRVSAFSQLLLDSAAEGILGIDAQGRTTFANPAALRMTGFAPEELLGRPQHELIHHAYADGAPYPVSDCPICNVRSGQEPRHVEGEVFRRRDGTNFPVEYTAVPLRDWRGRPGGAVITFRDVTERQQAERELHQTNAELRRSNAELEQFAYVASHDLQAPLRAVTSFTQLLGRHLDGQLDERATVFMGHIQVGAQRMKFLIDDLLLFSRASRVRQEFTAVPTEVVLQHALMNLHGELQACGARVTHDPLPQVHGNSHALLQVFQNLIGNAVKYRRPDVTPHVHVSARQDGEVWQFSVRDNGIGIERQFFEKIFLVFQRLHHHDQVEGTGIGLAVCQRVVERHGGRMWVESTVGEGTTFHFTLPQA